MSESSSLLLLAARASAAARGGAISVLPCAETRVLALCSPGIEFTHRFLRCFLAKNATAGGLHCTKSAELSISHRFFRCFPVCACVCVSHFASVFVVFFCSLHMPA